MIEIDGAQGEGGGQIIRSSLALSLITGKAVTLSNIRARRSRPGLQRQHLMAVHAAQQVGQAEVQGATLDSSYLRFVPRQVQAGDYHFDIGSAGSTTLVLQTILPALMTSSNASRITLQGGTHNPMAPPIDFLRWAFLPLLNRMGPDCEIDLQRHGFYPAGGGEVSVTIHPSQKLAGLDLLARGNLLERRVDIVLAKLPRHIAEREQAEFCRWSGWDAQDIDIHLVESRGPGNVMLAHFRYEHVTEVITSFGERRIPAEQVARTLWEEVSQYVQSGSPVGPHLADQLMLPMGLAAQQGHSSRFLTQPLTGHSQTQGVILQTFLDVHISCADGPPGTVELTIS